MPNADHPYSRESFFMRCPRLCGSASTAALRRAREEWKNRERKLWEKYGARFGAFVAAVEKKCAFSGGRTMRDADEVKNVRAAAIFATAAVLGATLRKIVVKEAIW